MSHKNSFFIQDLPLEVVEEILFRAEEAARKYIQAQIPYKEIKTFDILIDFNNETLNIDCIIDLELVKKSTFNPQVVIDEAIQKVFLIIETEIEKYSK